MLKLSQVVKFVPTITFLIPATSLPFVSAKLLLKSARILIPVSSGIPNPLTGNSVSPVWNQASKTVTDYINEAISNIYFLLAGRRTFNRETSF